MFHTSAKPDNKQSEHEYKDENNKKSKRANDVLF